MVVTCDMSTLSLQLCCWCFRKINKKNEATKQSEHAPYERTSFKEHLPTYSSQYNFPVIVRAPQQPLICLTYSRLLAKKVYYVKHCFQNIL